MKTIKPFFITLAIVLIIGAIFLFAQDDIKNAASRAMHGNTTTSGTNTKSKRAKASPITKAIVSKTINTYVEKEGGQIKEVFDSMSEEDKDTVIEIIATNVTLDSISDLSNAAAGNDSNAIITYAEKNFSEEDIEDLQNILEKYNVTP